MSAGPATPVSGDAAWSILRAARYASGPRHNVVADPLNPLPNPREHVPGGDVGSVAELGGGARRAVDRDA